jgi:hypothetical protein
MGLEKQGPKMVMPDKKEIEEKDNRDRQKLVDVQKSPAERLADPDYLQQVESIFADLQNGALLEDVNMFEKGEYCLRLREVTGKLKTYSFEFVLPVRLNPKRDEETPEDVTTRQTQELKDKLDGWYKQAQDIIAKK